MRVILYSENVASFLNMTPTALERSISEIHSSSSGSTSWVRMLVAKQQLTNHREGVQPSWLLSHLTASSPRPLVTERTSG